MSRSRLGVGLFFCMAALAGCGSSSSKTSTDGGSDAGCTPFDAGPVDTALAQQGLSIIEMRNCQTCHGSILSGNNNGVQVQGTNITQYPPNLTPDPNTGLGCWTNDQVVRAILYGIDNQGQVLCPPMPQWADAGMTTADAEAVVAFLRTLPRVVNQVANGPSCTCDTSSDCTDGLVCLNEICELGNGMASNPDGGAPDAGAPDAGESDGGELDAGEFDAGEFDAGEFDAGELDAGDLDAGDWDAGDLDAGSADAGDGGSPDRGLHRWQH